MKIADIRVTYHLRVPKDKEDETRRAFDQHSEGCPAYQSVKDSINVSIDADFDWD